MAADRLLLEGGTFDGYKLILETNLGYLVLETSDLIGGFGNAVWRPVIMPRRR